MRRKIVPECPDTSFFTLCALAIARLCRAALSPGVHRGARAHEAVALFAFPLSHPCCTRPIGHP